MQRRKAARSSELRLLQDGDFTSKEAEWLRELERENMRLKKIASELTLENLVLRDTVERDARRFH